jgi:drug/metabolite transporter (DMT)-like permease
MVQGSHVPPNLRRSLPLLIGLPILFWSFAFPLIRIGLEEGLSFVNLTILRLWLVNIIFIVILLQRRQRFSNLHRQDIPLIFFLGFIGIVVYHLGLNYGEQYVSPGAASLIIATIPIYVAILGALFLKEHLTKAMIISIIISLCGVIIISTLGTANVTLEIQYLSGAIAVVVAAIVAAIYTIIGKKLLVRYSALSLTAYAFLLGSLSLLPLLGPSFLEQVGSLSFKGWFAVVFLAIFPTVISYVLWYMALEVMQASEISVYLYFIPILSTAISYMLRKETITPMYILGGILVIAGLYLVSKDALGKKRKNGMQDSDAI